MGLLCWIRAKCRNCAALVPAYAASLLLLIVMVLGGCGKPDSGAGGAGKNSGENENGGNAGTTQNGENKSQSAKTATSRASRSGKPIVLRLPMRTDGPKSLDPVKGSTVYDNRAASLVYDTLLHYRYRSREPFELTPLLLTEMPTVSDDGKTYHFKLKQGVRFHDDPSFAGGKGRELAAGDVFYSWKRMADNGNLPKSWWLLENTIEGFDEYRKEQNAAESFDYGAPVSGMQIINDHEFKVVLKEPVQRFMWVLAMFQTSIVPREAVEKYGDRFGRHPVGTGAFTMGEGDWVPGKSMVLTKNPHYHQRYDAEIHGAGDVVQIPDGTPLPIADRVEFTMFVQDQPMWLKFKNKDIDYTQVPAENFDEAFIKRKGARRGAEGPLAILKPDYRKQGVTDRQVKLLDMIFYGFNMDDPLLGGYADESRYLRQAISLALDWEERNDAFYNGINVIYDGPIPPGMDGHPENGKAPVSYLGPDLDRAKDLLARAGYPNGAGLPKINLYTSLGGNNQEQVEMTQRQLAKINVKVDPQLVDFSTLIEAVTNRKAPFFAFAWGSDYPDAENNLALFYGPNESPGSNHFNYKNEEYDRLYEQIRTMPPSPERTALYEQMRDMIIEAAPFAGSMARTRFYLVNPRLKNFDPSETFYDWVKYLDVAEK